MLAPVKDEDRERLGLPNGELKKKDVLRAQDETKRKNFVKYYKWKFGLYNQANLHSPERESLIMRHDDEYMACCVKQVPEPAP